MEDHLAKLANAIESMSKLLDALVETQEQQQITLVKMSERIQALTKVMETEHKLKMEERAAKAKLVIDRGWYS